MITAILCTGRENPRFDVMADSLSTAINTARIPFELVVVDKLLWGNEAIRRVELARAIDGRFAYTHIPPMLNTWQGPKRLCSRDYYALNDARNTGVCFARYNYISFFDDCSLLDENWLMYHARTAAKNVGIAGSFITYNSAKIENGKIIEGDPHPGTDHRGNQYMIAYPSWGFGLNMGFPLHWILKVNGWDTKFSGQGGSDDVDCSARMCRAGMILVYNPECLVYQILETHTAVCDFETWGNPQPRKQKEIVLKDGRGHFANEYLIQELYEDHTRILPQWNPYNLAEIRQKALSGGYKTLPILTEPTIDWRDQELISQM